MAKDFLLRGLPYEVYEIIEHNAKLNGRSVNKEILQLLKKVKKEK